MSGNKRTFGLLLLCAGPAQLLHSMAELCLVQIAVPVCIKELEDPRRQQVALQLRQRLEIVQGYLAAAVGQSLKPAWLTTAKWALLSPAHPIPTPASSVRAIFQDGNTACVLLQHDKQ